MPPNMQTAFDILRPFMLQDFTAGMMAVFLIMLALLRLCPHLSARWVGADIEYNFLWQKEWCRKLAANTLYSLPVPSSALWSVLCQSSDCSIHWHLLWRTDWSNNTLDPPAASKYPTGPMKGFFHAIWLITESPKTTAGGHKLYSSWCRGICNLVIEVDAAVLDWCINHYLQYTPSVESCELVREKMQNTSKHKYHFPNWIRTGNNDDELYKELWKML